MEVASRDMGFDKSMLAALHGVLDLVDDVEKLHQPSRAYIRDKRAMKSELKSEQIKVHLEDSNTLAVSGEWRREREREREKYVKMERRFGKLSKKFVLPENVNKESISAFYEAGVLTVKVEKKPPPKPKKPKVIEVKGGVRQEVKTNWHETEESWGRFE